MQENSNSYLALGLTQCQEGFSFSQSLNYNSQSTCKNTQTTKSMAIDGSLIIDMIQSGETSTISPCKVPI